MEKPKLLIVVLFQNLGDENPYYAQAPAPPASGSLLAALTPSIVEIELMHEMNRPINYDTDADFIALSFMDFCAPHAYDVAKKFKSLGKIVIAGGRYPTSFPELVSPHVDVVVVGEAERIWAKVIEDIVDNNYQKIYTAPFSASLENIPPPRYDLVESAFMTPVVTEASRGCPYRCWFCQLNIKPAPYRIRPIKDVINDLTATERLPFYKRKMAMLLDNNLGGDMEYAKNLLREIVHLKLWGLGVQFTVECLEDDEFLELLEKANVCMAFVGMESLHQESLESVRKNHNVVGRYKELFLKLKRRGILIFTGVMFALDEDTVEYYNKLPQKLNEVDPSAILTSISVPIPGTPFYKKMNKEGRIFDHDLRHYEGDHLVFTPNHVTEEEVFKAFINVNKDFYSLKNVLRRWFRFIMTMSYRKNFFHQLFRMIIQSIILFKLSKFQKHHAEIRVFNNSVKYKEAV
jgi:radical SAM superfamily enzyme YgiQ (UPF0313 family)